MFKKIDKIIYIVFSFILALLLAFYVDSTVPSKTSKVQNDTSGTTKNLLGIGLQKTETMTMPIQLSGIDTNEYIVIGVPETMGIKLTGPTAMVTTTMNTKNFQIYANLKGLSDGEHYITLKVSGLNKDLTYKLDQTKLKVSIYKRATKNFTVTPTFNKEAVAEGYEAGDATSSVTSAQVIGSRNAVVLVDRVVANVQLNRDTKDSVTKKVTLQALDINGNAVDVTISPAEATVKIPIKAGNGSKQVPLKISTKNGDASKFTVTANINEVTVAGKMDALEKLKSVSVTADLSNVTAVTEETVTIASPDGASTITPGTVVITITPKNPS
ncbi:hypothetical protein H9L19_05390 [Weissella diestrammenae]|uniref:YbbR-like domain-containing protein n=1 Tax=Weissella diestrammenae TaxID=1162633 RepID=A0A7G9T416_9LACO|nr:CdaR family protein [Weissella diestrammenae]MCM0583039.1 hypothetical protein [Weissella diestrammenae]QNN74841.1 hypothetical protein H9L19_05390 [Weissella diestrammenae]